jgi:hypothetical protein
MGEIVIALSAEGQLIALAEEARQDQPLAADLIRKDRLEGYVVVGDAYVGVVGRVGGSALLIVGAV